MNPNSRIYTRYLIGNSFKVLKGFLALCCPRVEILEEFLSGFLYEFIESRKIRGADAKSGYELTLESLVRIPGILEIELQGFCERANALPCVADADWIDFA